uniref:Unspecific monooxygenase n=1 Tax=Steinernema glaseri TaxID=37863 RepID=A0A1I8A0L6_9BILA
MLAVVLCLAVLFWVARFYLGLRKYPPGPLPLPLFGNLGQIFINWLRGKSLTDLLYQWKKDHGNVITFWVGPFVSVCVLDYDLAVETYVKNGDVFVGRQQFPVLTEIREGLGIIFSQGPLWLEQRRFALHTLRDFGLGRNSMQEKILDEYHKRMDPLDAKIDSEGGKLRINPKTEFLTLLENILDEYHKRIDPLDAKIDSEGGKLRINPKTEFLTLLVGSIINRILVGYSFDESNMDEFLEIRNAIERANESVSVFDFVLLCTGWKDMPFINKRYELMMEGEKRSVAFGFRQLNRRREEIESGKYQLVDDSDAKDFIDAFLLEIKRREESGEEKNSFIDKQLVYAILDMWSAGMETTITTLSWAFLYLLKNPEVQEKMRKELLEVCGYERDVELSDRQLLPYCNATITEVHRATSLLTLNVMRRNTEDTTIGGYSVPQGTDNAVLMSVIFKDEDIFKNPTLFNPERYLGEDGKEIEQKVIPFGVGKRSCLGEGLAKAEIYLILLNIVKSYRIVDCDGVDANWLESNNMFVRIPKSYECVFEKVQGISK